MTSHSKSVMLKKALEKIKWLVTFKWLSGKRWLFFTKPQEGNTINPSCATRTYTVMVEEILRKEVQVEASSSKEAFKIAWEGYCSGQCRYKPNRDNFYSVNVDVEEDEQLDFYSND